MKNHKIRIMKEQRGMLKWFLRFFKSKNEKRKGGTKHHEII